MSVVSDLISHSACALHADRWISSGLDGFLRIATKKKEINKIIYILIRLYHKNFRRKFLRQFEKLS